MKKYYVYIHKYATGPKAGQVFYVGKGQGGRWKNRSDRNKDWTQAVSEFGFTSHIISRFSREACAYSMEVALISRYGVENLVNISHGGEGVSWGGSRAQYCGDGNPRYDVNIYEFEHPEKGCFNGTKSALSEKFGVSIFGVYSIVSGKRTHVGGWHIKGVTPILQKGHTHPFYDPTEYTFKHPVHGQVTCSRHDLCKKFSLSRSNLNQMMRGVYKTTKGWELA